MLTPSETQVDYQTLYEEAPVAYFSVSPGAYIQQVNQPSLELLGYTREEIIGRSVITLYADTGAGRVKARRVIQRLHQGASRAQEELQMKRADGHTIWVQLTVHPIRDEDGTIQRFQSVAVDISERKQMEATLHATHETLEQRVAARTQELEAANEALRDEVRQRKAVQEQQARQVAAMDAAQAGISIHDAGGTFRYANNAHAHIYGYDTASDLVGQSWRMLYSEAEQAYIETEVFPAVQKNGQWAGELTGRKKNGETFPVYLTLTKLDSGGLTCTCEDISDRKRREQQLKMYTQRLEVLRDIDQSILEARSPQAIAQAAMKRLHRLVPCSRSSIALFDKNAGQGTVLARYSQGASTLDTGQTLPLEHFETGPDVSEAGAYVVNNLDAIRQTPLIEALKEEGITAFMAVPMEIDDTTIGLVNVGTNTQHRFKREEQRILKEVTDQLTIAIRQAQLLEQVQQQTERLEQRVEERTKELESFTYSVSHDLRTPLRAVDGFAKLLMDSHADQLDDEGQRLLNVIYESAQRMGQLIDDLLALSRLGRREMRQCTVDMEAVAHDVTQELARSYPHAPESVTIEALPPASGDQAMLRQVLSNLISNALKFTSESTDPQVQVGVRAKQDMLTYYVHDNGAGFDMDYADKLFGVFQRLHDDDEFEGTGVGLAIVERVIRRHNGRVWAEGEEGCGATFYFTLPAAKDAMDC